MLNILLVDDDVEFSDVVCHIVEFLGHNISTATSLKEAHQWFENNTFDHVLLDFMLPDGSGLHLLDHLKIIGQSPKITLISGHPSVKGILADMCEPNIGHLLKPLQREDLELVLNGPKKVAVKKAKTSGITRHFGSLIGESEPMHKLYNMIERVAKTNANVMLMGESGAGKEVAAQAIHRLSKKKNGPFIALNCAAIPSELMESEIFGHIKGAFSGAVSNRDGAASLANGGSLFLDEIGEMDIGLQAKLLRFIQTGCFQKVGSGKEEKVDIRFISATNRDPQIAIAEHKLREDLFYRLNVISIDLPALNERDNDIIKLAEHFLSHFSDIEEKAFAGFSSGAEELIKSYSWPGNVRQLQNIIHSSTVMSEGPLISEKIIAQQLSRQSKQAEPTFNTNKQSNIPATNQNNQHNNVHQVNHSPSSIITLAEVEKQAIEQAIDSCQDNIVKAASELGVSPSTLYRKIQQWQTSPAE